MTRTRSLFTAFHARLHADERGFSLVETVIAAGVIFASLLTLAFTATAGFGYQDLARQRQAATGLANQVMEEVRGLAYEKIQLGLLSTDLSGDPNIVSCSGVYKFLSCTAGTEPGSGETIVSSPGLPATIPIVPHRSSTSPNTNPVLDGTTYQWATYVTRDLSVTSAPYRVSVIVTWTGGVKGSVPNKLVRVQSLFWSPDGCRNTDTHPFAAPCQPFFYGTAIIPQTSVAVSGTIDGLAFESGELLLPEASSSAQQEQIVQAQGAWQGGEVVMTAAGAETLGGGTSGSTNADSDPGTTTGTYSRYRCPTEVTCASGSLGESDEGNSISLTVPTTTAESDSTTSATASNVCPPPTATGETDGLSCSGARILQGGTARVAILITDDSLFAPGVATVARVAAPSTASTTFVHRNAFPTTSGCTPASTADGCMTLSASRALGTVNLGGLPTAFIPPLGWTGTDAWNGYLVSLVGFTDSVTGAAGTNAVVPTTTQSGTIYYWNGAGYSSLAVTDAGVPAISSSLSVSQLIDGHTVAVTISVAAGGITAGTTSATPTSPAGTATRSEVSAQSAPPTFTLTYQLSSDSVQLANLTVSVNLGTLEATGTYQPAPASGT